MVSSEVCPTVCWRQCGGAARLDGRQIGVLDYPSPPRASMRSTSQNLRGSCFDDDLLALITRVSTDKLRNCGMGNPANSRLFWQRGLFSGKVWVRISLASDNPLVSFASRTSSLNPPPLHKHVKAE
jgi:hypothetical protein